MERQLVKVDVGSILLLDEVEIDEAINHLIDLKSQGATHIDNDSDYCGFIGMKYEIESDEVYNQRVQLYENDKKREHEKDLVEFARLKAKLFPEQ